MCIVWHSSLPWQLLPSAVWMSVCIDVFVRQFWKHFCIVEHLLVLWAMALILSTFSTYAIFAVHATFWLQNFILDLLSIYVNVIEVFHLRPDK